MHLRRAKLWFSSERLRACSRLFQNPWYAHLGLAFVSRGWVQVVLKNGKKLAFSRSRRDHSFWDWALSQDEASFDFTAEGEVRLKTATHDLLLRSGTSDFFAFREIFLQDCYGLAALPSRLGTVVDLGANVGLFTCAIQDRARRVIAVEPVAAHFRQAHKNIVKNGGDGAGLLRLAVAGQSDQEIAIHVDDRTAGASSLFRSFCKSSREHETVRTTSLPDLLESTGCGEIDLLKCDVEGAEYEIFSNTPLPVLRRIRRLVMEVHLAVDEGERKQQALIAHLREAGLRVTVFIPSTGRPVRNRILKAFRN